MANKNIFRAESDGNNPASDAVFEVVAAFADRRLGPDHWVGVIDAVEV